MLARLRLAVAILLGPIFAGTFFTGVGLGTVGCATQSGGDATAGIVAAAGLQASYATVDGFELLVVRGASSPAGGVAEQAATSLHVYIAGDGTPWRGNRVTGNPGPFKPLAIKLMLLDPSPSILLGRPCYHRQTANCRPSLWSFERFSPTVVDVMAKALRQLLDQRPETRLTLVGYSGGGVLATLLAREVASVDSLVTVAAPLDVAAWSRHHNYSPLLGSLDPAQLPPLRDTVAQLHLQGVADKEVPPVHTRAYFAAQQRPEGGIRRVLDGQAHRCCWLQQWPRLLQERTQAER